MASAPPRLSLMRILPLVPALILLAAAAPAVAQSVVGDVTQPDVTVDRSVLDSLGPEPTLPELLLRRQSPVDRNAAALAARRAAPREREGRIALRPPKAKTAAAKPKKPEVAAHKAAPVKPVATANDAAPVARESVAATPLPEPAPTPAAAAASPAPEQQAAVPPEPKVTEPKPAAPAAPITPTAAPPTPPPTVAPPSAETVAAMKAPPSLPAAVPITPTPAAVPAALSSGEPARILFAGAGSDLPDGAKSELDAVVVRLHADEHLRLQLVAYASGTADQSNQARRISLQRALAVRTYLMERGIPNTRMDVRALGNHTDGGDPPDRVDIVMLEH